MKIFYLLDKFYVKWQNKDAFIGQAKLGMKNQCDTPINTLNYCGENIILYLN